MAQKKKVLALTVDTALTNEQLEGGGHVQVTWIERGAEGDSVPGVVLEARNVRVLDSDLLGSG